MQETVLFIQFVDRGKQVICEIPYIWTAKETLPGLDCRLLRPFAYDNYIFCLGSPCSMSIGIDDGRIQDSAMRASSIANKNHVANLARLNLVAASGKAGAWCAKVNNVNQWLHLDLGTPTTVTKVATQGRQDNSNWITNYSLSYSLAGSFWVQYTVRGRKKVTN